MLEIKNKNATTVSKLQQVSNYKKHKTHHIKMSGWG